MAYTKFETTLASNVADNGTLTLTYPTGVDAKDKGNFQFGVGHKALYNGTSEMRAPKDFEVTFGTRAAGITVTNRSEATWESGKTFVLEAQEPGPRAFRDADSGMAKALLRGQRCKELLLLLGQPLALNADQFVKAATSTESPNAETVSYTPATNGTSPTDDTMVLDIENFQGRSCWIMDVPRNLTASVTHGSSVVAMTITVRGYDEYGVEMRETLTIAATGTSQTAAGKKAFKAVYQVDLIAAGDSEANTVNVGFGDVIGLPVMVPAGALILSELVDGANIKPAGTVTVSVPINSTDLLAGTSQVIASPVAGKVTKLTAMVQTTTGIGGDLNMEINDVSVLGLTVTIGNSVTAGAVAISDAPTGDATQIVAVGDKVEIIPTSAFSVAGALNTIVQFTGNGATSGTLVAGSAVEPSASSADIRGTYTPPTPNDGSQALALMVALPDPGYLGAQNGLQQWNG